MYYSVWKAAKLFSQIDQDVSQINGLGPWHEVHNNEGGEEWKGATLYTCYNPRAKSIPTASWHRGAKKT